MTEQEVNIIVAKLCGWTMIHIETELNPDKDRRTYLAGKSPLVISDCEIEDYFKMEVPHYATDLNAMHQAEKMFLEGYHNVPEHADRFADAYAFELLKKVATWPIGFEWGSVCNEDYWKIAHATSRQRAEAFIAVFAK